MSETHPTPEQVAKAYMEELIERRVNEAVDAIRGSKPELTAPDGAAIFTEKELRSLVWNVYTTGLKDMQRMAIHRKPPE